MKRRWLVRGIVLVAILGSALPAQAAGAVMPAAARFRGHDLVSLHRDYMGWVLGSAESPVLTGSCGAVMDGMFFLAPAAAPGTTELDCDLPTGMPILVLVGVTFSEIPTWGADDAAVLADARATWAGVTGNSLWVDGAEQDVAGHFREAGVFDIAIEEGSIEDIQCASLTPPCVIDFEPPGPVRLASIGIFAVVRPLPPGEHEIVATTSNPFVDLTVDATIHVG
jgi:hypothetical protein